MRGASFQTARRLGLAALAAVLLLGAWPAAAGETNLPVPRFVALRSDEVNVRTGPGQRYPIQWVYHRRGLPVEVIAEFDTWRKIRDWEGGEGWVHQSTLSGRRTMIVTGQVRTIRRAASAEAPAIAHAEPTVVGQLLECRAEWCRVDVSGYEGWMRRQEFWGAYPDETLE